MSLSYLYLDLDVHRWILPLYVSWQYEYLDTVLFYQVRIKTNTLKGTLGFCGGPISRPWFHSTYLSSSQVIIKSEISVGETGACWLWDSLSLPTEKQKCNIKRLPSYIRNFVFCKTTWKVKGSQLGSTEHFMRSKVKQKQKKYKEKNQH